MYVFKGVCVTVAAAGAVADLQKYTAQLASEAGQLPAYFAN